MNLSRMVKDIKQRIEAAPDRLALAILIWLEKEPSQKRILLPPSDSQLREPYLRYRQNDNRYRRSMAEKETAA